MFLQLVSTTIVSGLVRELKLFSSSVVVEIDAVFVSGSSNSYSIHVYSGVADTRTINQLSMLA